MKLTTIRTFFRFTDVYSGVSPRTVIEKFEIDFSAALISGILQYFEGRDVYRYFVKIWEAMENGSFFDSIVIHICRWHFFKTVIKQMKTKYKGKANSDLILNELGKIVRRLAAMSTLESFERIVADIIVIVGSPKLTAVVKRRVRLLNTATNKLSKSQIL